MVMTLFFFVFSIFSTDLPSVNLQLLPLELVFNGMKRTTLFSNKDGPLLEVYPEVEQLVLLEDG